MYTCTLKSVSIGLHLSKQSGEAVLVFSKVLFLIYIQSISLRPFVVKAVFCNKTSDNDDSLTVVVVVVVLIRVIIVGSN